MTAYAALHAVAAPNFISPNPTNYGWFETSGGANAWSFLVSDVVGTGTGTGTLDHNLLY